MKCTKKVKKNTWGIQLFQGNIALEKSRRKKPYAWFPDEGWEDVIRLAEVFPDNFGSLLEDIEKNEKAWKRVC